MPHGRLEVPLQHPLGGGIAMWMKPMKMHGCCLYKMLDCWPTRYAMTAHACCAFQCCTLSTTKRSINFSVSHAAFVVMVCCHISAKPCGNLLFCSVACVCGIEAAVNIGQCYRGSVDQLSPVASHVTWGFALWLWVLVAFWACWLWCSAYLTFGLCQMSWTKSKTWQYRVPALKER